jgi:hypothetical protein
VVVRAIDRPPIFFRRRVEQRVKVEGAQALAGGGANRPRVLVRWQAVGVEDRFEGAEKPDLASQFAAGGSG